MGDMQAQTTVSKNVGYDQVWALLQETIQSQKETDRMMKETDQRMKETDQMMKKTDRMMKKNARRYKELANSQKELTKSQEETGLQMKETDRQIKEYNKRFGDFTNRFGEVVEYMIAPNLQDKFYEMGLDFQTVSSNFKVNDHKNNIHLQIDVFLQNGETAMLVEIKTKLTISDINEHIKRMEKMRVFADLRKDKRAFLGAVAGVVVESDEREYALNNGFYLIEPSGETFNITVPFDKPREW